MDKQGSHRSDHGHREERSVRGPSTRLPSSPVFGSRPSRGRVGAGGPLEPVQGRGETRSQVPFGHPSSRPLVGKQKGKDPLQKDPSLVSWDFVSGLGTHPQVGTPSLQSLLSNTPHPRPPTRNGTVVGRRLTSTHSTPSPKRDTGRVGSSGSSDPCFRTGEDRDEQVGRRSRSQSRVSSTRKACPLDIFCEGTRDRDISTDLVLSSIWSRGWWCGYFRTPPRKGRTKTQVRGRDGWESPEGQEGQEGSTTRFGRKVEGHTLPHQSLN